MMLDMMYDFNKVLCEGGKKKFTMTFFALCLDLDENVAYYVNAGHNFPFLIQFLIIIRLIWRFQYYSGNHQR